MNNSIIKSIVRVELAVGKPKTNREALRIVGRVLNTYSNLHTDIFDKRRNCAKWLKKNMFAA